MLSIPEENLSSHVFTDRDIVFVRDKADVYYLFKHSNHTIGEARLFPLSADAHGAAMRGGHPRIQSPYDWIDYPAYLATQGAQAEEWATRWFGERNLSLYIEDINLEKLDRVNQLLFFQEAAYVAHVVQAALRDVTAADQLYLLAGETVLPLDYYFDSDIGSAVTRYLCEQAGRPVGVIAKRHRLLRLPDWGETRPFSKSNLEARAFLTPRAADEPSDSRRCLGVVPGCVGNIGDILSSLQSLNVDLTLFSSGWSKAVAGQELDVEPADDAWLSKVRESLDAYWIGFIHRTDRSTLPDYLGKNPYLDFQFEYIIRHRWYSYAQFIGAAARFVRSHPLDLLFYCDHFIVEGAVLAELYRRQGTRAVMLLHSQFPVGWPFIPWDSQDAAIVPSRTAAAIVHRRGNLASIATVGSPWRVRDIVAAESLRQSLLGTGPARKIIVVVTNCLEVQVPAVDIPRQFATLRRLAVPPPDLADRVLVLVRRKMGIFAEDWLLYRDGCGLTQASVTALDGLTFAEAVDLADCVVGMNFPTSGYTEVMMKAVPLVHVQTAAISSDGGVLYPDEVLNLVASDDALWPEIEAVLFDDTHRAAVIERQSAHVAEDCLMTDEDPMTRFRAAVVALLPAPEHKEDGRAIG